MNRLKLWNGRQSKAALSFLFGLAISPALLYPGNPANLFSKIK